jgi:hypothetical protein
MNRATVIEKLTEVQKIVEQLLAQLQVSEQDKFASHLYQARREYRHVSERPGTGNKDIERVFYRASRSRRDQLRIQRRLPRLGALAAHSRMKNQRCKSQASHALTAAFVIRSLQKRSSENVQTNL